MRSLRIYVDFSAPTDALDFLRANAGGHELIFPAKPAASVLSKGEMDPLMAEADAAFGQPDTQAIAQSPRLKWVHVSSAGITRYDTPEFRAMAAERKLGLTNSSSVFFEACAVHVFSFMLAQARKLPLGLRTRTAGGTDTWDELRAVSRTLRGESVLILGYGAIGRRLAELLGPLHMEVKAYRRRARGDEVVPVVGAGQLEAELARTDHVVNILPDSAETKQFFNRARLAAIKPGALFYNIGRGSTVDQDALAEALLSGRLGAAWLDVTDPEPLPEGHPLLGAPNCHITPHVAGGQFGESRALVRHFLGNLERFSNGQPMQDRVM